MHALLPLLALLAMRFDARKVLWLWPLTLAPDLDYFFGLHRAATGSALWMVPFAVGFAWTWWRPAKGWWNREAFFVALVYLGSHLVMDVFDGGVVALYPLSTYTWCYEAGVNVFTDVMQPVPFASSCSHGVAAPTWAGGADGVVSRSDFTAASLPPVRKLYGWIQPGEVAILAWLVPVAALAWWRTRRTPAAPSEAALPVDE